MITLFTGMPGAGKTASMVDHLSKLPGDRPIFADGLNGLKIPHTPCDATKWHEELPDGAILVIDEVQRVWRPRGSGARVPDSVAALETHRHRGIDIFITTQAPRLMDANVRGLVGRHVHIRDTGVLGRYWYEWPECNDSMTWKTCINKKRIRLPKKSFDLYTSASLHTVPVRGVPRALIYGMAALVAFFVLAFFVYQTVQVTQAPNPDTSIPAPLAAVPAVTTQSQQSEVLPPSYDPTAFFPRVSSKPETAPAYDHLRVVVAMPIISGGICMGQKCKCLTNQGTDSGLSSDECKIWMEHRPFNPYQLPDAPSRVNANPSAPPAIAPPVATPETRPTADLSAGYSATFPPVKTRLY